MNDFIKNNTNNKFTYASLIGYPPKLNINTDLLGIELFASDIGKFEEKFSSKESTDSLIYFISEATYPTYKGATNGYLNRFSFEGQAKFFDDVISLTKDSNLNGFVLSNMFDYKGDFAPMFSGFNEDNIYNIGILPNDGSKSRISYNLIKSRLNSNSKVSVPIGNNHEDAPLFFIIYALIISVIIALLINSKRKFREDATRALLRPYNFFADIRDQRILSGFHSNILMFLLAGANSLLFTIVLYFLKNNILFDKIIISFGNYELSSMIGFLAWNPEKAFIYIYITTIIVFIFISFLVHLTSFFVKTRVLYSSVYAVAIWAFLPLALLLPIETVLYKILLTQAYNHIIYIVLILFFIWNIQRFLKGIYVIFDVRPLFVYFYAFLALIIFLSAIGVYFQFTVSAFDYISLAIKQYILL
jgi:beta-galactosidase